jgi:hypothetical protein
MNKIALRSYHSFAACIYIEEDVEGNNSVYSGENYLLAGRFPAFAVLGANTQPAPIVTAHLAEIAILARMLFGAFLGYFGNINLSRYAGQFNKWHEFTPVVVTVEFRPI